jgi:hypothetical protein
MTKCLGRVSIWTCELEWSLSLHFRHLVSLPIASSSADIWLLPGWEWRDSPPSGLLHSGKPEQFLWDSVTPPLTKPQTPISTLALRFSDTFLPWDTLNNGDASRAGMRRVCRGCEPIIMLWERFQVPGCRTFLHVFRKASDSWKDSWLEYNSLINTSFLRVSF